MLVQDNYRKLVTVPCINDVILSFNNKPVDNLRDLLEARMSVIGANTGVVIFRNQKEIKKRVELRNRK